jgi:hypothetical protein
MTRTALLVFVAACGSTSYVPPADGGGAGTSCAGRTGNYVAHFVERAGGTCGAIPDTVIAASGIASGCQGTATPAADDCTVDVNETCTVSGQTLKETGTSHWSSDGATGSATLTIKRLTASGETQCLSTYDATFAKA